MARSSSSSSKLIATRVRRGEAPCGLASTTCARASAAASASTRVGTRCASSRIKVRVPRRASEPLRAPVRARECAEQGCDATGDDPASSPCVVIAPLLAIAVISFVVYFVAVRGREGEAPPLP
jgi:hypothetical protein